MSDRAMPILAAPRSTESEIPVSRASSIWHDDWMSIDELMELPPDADIAVIPRSGKKTAFEKRRRFATVIFGIAVGLALVAVRSRWGATSATGESLSVAGLCLAMIGGLGRIWCNLFISGHKSKDLITVGPYSLCRNPLYFFSAIGLIGIGMATCTFVVPALLAFAFAVYYPSVIAAEEERLHRNHGSAFDHYRKTVPAFFPKVSGYREPESYTFSPQALRRILGDSFWFVFLASLANVLAELQSRGDVLPRLFSTW
jgi:protein-S-isoprenylcysteine O-methyltransferase Ste14